MCAARVTLSFDLLLLPRSVCQIAAFGCSCLVLGLRENELSGRSLKSPVSILALLLPVALPSPPFRVSVKEKATASSCLKYKQTAVGAVVLCSERSLNACANYTQFTF